MLATVADPNLGGSNFDRMLADYFVTDFKKRYNINVTSQPRAYLRLVQECERLKKLMSANSQEIPLNIECFMEEKDVTGKMSREMMEKMAEGLLSKIDKMLVSVLDLASEHLAYFQFFALILNI